MNTSLEIVAYSKHRLKLKCKIVNTIELTIDLKIIEGVSPRRHVSWGSSAVG